MITPLSVRPLHALREVTQTTADWITSIFFRVLSYVNSKWTDHAKYYSHLSVKLIQEEGAGLDVYSKFRIQKSINRIRPFKAGDVTLPTNLNQEKFSVVKGKDGFEGLCAGMCYDYMRRVKDSKRAFDVTLNEVGNKFARGSTKKGYKAHKISGQLKLNVNYFYERILNKYDHSVLPKKIARERVSIGLQRKNIQNKIRIIFPAFKAKLTGMAWPYDPEKIPEGDYFLVTQDEKSGHQTCLFKRKEGIGYFDPNYGTYLFKNMVALSAFISKANVPMYKKQKVKLELFKVE